MALAFGGIRSVIAVTTAQQFQQSTSAFPNTGGRVTMRADESRKAGDQLIFQGNVSIEVGGVTVRADRAVIRDGQYQLEGNVRMKVDPSALPIYVQVPVAPTPPTP